MQSVRNYYLDRVLGYQYPEANHSGRKNSKQVTGCCSPTQENGA